MVSPEIMRDTDLMLKSKQSGVEKPVKLTKKKTATILRRNTLQLEDRDRKCVIANNNILLLSRSDMEPANKTFNMATVVNTVKRSVILPQADKVKGKEAESPLRIPRVSDSGLTVRKLCVRPVRLESKEVRPGPVLVNRVQTCSVNLGRKSEPPQEPINLSLKPQDKEKKIFLKVVDENKLKYSQDKTEETTSMKSDPVYSVSSRSPEVSIIPVINLTDNSGQDSQPIERDEDTNDSREDIDDDEESFLQKMGEEIGDMVQVKLECEEGESKKQTKLSYSCPKCNRSYSKKSLCEIHMKKVHFSLRSKEKCNICGVRFINLQAHKEKYHYFVDVDKCHLCGKVGQKYSPNQDNTLSLPGGEISLFPSLSPSEGSQTEGGQVGVSEVWESRQAEVSQDPPKESLCRNQLYLLKLQNCQSGQSR